MDTLLKIGEVLSGGEQRDAIHIAVAPVEAAEHLGAAQMVGVRDGKAVAEQPYVGIVDPFLKREVKRGERFYIFMFPYTARGLRHERSHPAFPQDDRRSVSERWMRGWAVKHVGYDYYGEEHGKVDEDVAYDFAIKAGHDMHIGPYESARDYINDEWWSHWENITGVRGRRDEYMGCAC